MDVRGREPSRITHFHLFCGSGSGAYGFNQGHARVGAMEAEPECVGGVDNDPTACKDFQRMVGAPATCLDLFDLDQFLGFHGQCVGGSKRCRGCNNTGRPPLGWRPATGADLRRASGGVFPDIVFTSSPCKGLSGLLSPQNAGKPRYVALNGLTVRGIELTLEAFAAHPPRLIIFENVPRIENRGGPLIAEIRLALEMAGYAVSTTTHDCGELGGLAQHRRRFLLVARHKAQVRPFLYEPPKQRVKGVGEVLGEMPLPDDPGAGPMHTSPNLDWKTWVRLALIPAGGDWRSLEGMDYGSYRIAPATGWRNGVLGVRGWEEAASTVTAQNRPGNSAAASVGDPRTQNMVDGGKRFTHCYQVVRWDRAAGAVTSATGNTAGCVADPRAGTDWSGGGKYRVTLWEEGAGTVIAASTTGNGAFAVSDPRPPPAVVERDGHVYGVTEWNGTAETVTGKAAAGGGRFSVADPRLGAVDDPRIGGGKPEPGADFKSQGHYGVLAWDEPAGAVIGAACQDNGPWSVSDPRMPKDEDRPNPVPVIISLDNTWHRPFTTLELMALQSYPWRMFLAEPLGGSDALRREHIGNAVPAASATAIASEMYRTLLLQRAGQSFALSATPIWVQRIAAGVSIAQEGERW